MNAHLALVTLAVIVSGCATSQSAEGAPRAQTTTGCAAELADKYMVETRTRSSNILLTRRTERLITAREYCKMFPKEQIDFAKEVMDLGLTTDLQQAFAYYNLGPRPLRCALDEYKTKPAGTEFTLSKQCEAAR